jgi:curved DNA-binding protein
MTRGSLADYYEILQISPNADQETIERMYRFLAKKYHPDNPASGREEQFKLLLEAYHTLSDPEKRAAYDVKRGQNKHSHFNLFNTDTKDGDLGTDQRIQQSILNYLYQARRRDAQNPGIGVFEMEKLLSVPEKHLEFHIWYLKEKSWIRRTDTGQYEITANGVDALIQNSTTAAKEQILLKASYREST